MNNKTLPEQRSVAVAIATLIAGVCVYYVTVHNRLGSVMALLSDDAFYYFKIASNIVSGNGSTFDGIAPTNGFHPMWMLLMVAVFGVAGNDPITPVTVVIVINLLLCIATFVLLYRLVDEYVAPGYAWITVAACTLPNILTGMLNGLETGLMLLLVVLTLRMLYRDRPLSAGAPASGGFGLGIMLGVVTLCRLDSVFLFAAAFGLTAASAAVRRSVPKTAVVRLALLSGGFALAVAPYFAWNLLSFGHLSPISGVVKSTFPVISARALHIGGDKGFGALMLVAIGVLLALSFFADRSRERDWKTAAESPLVLLALACSLHFANTMLFLEWGVYWWHYGLYGLTLALAAAKFVRRLSLRSPRLRRLAITVVVLPLLIVAATAHSRILQVKNEQHRGWPEGAEWVRENTPPGTVIAAKDAGIVGYFSERPVINLDGKANGYEYLRHLRNDDVAGYLTSRDTEYLINVRGVYHDGFMRIFIRRAGRPHAHILVSEENEVFRSSEIPSSVGRLSDASRTRLYIWKYVPDLKKSDG
jgi:hypothetical protein